MTKSKRELAKRVLAEGTFHSTSGNEVWTNNFYKLNNSLFNLQYKNGKPFDVISYGR